ncbi:acyl-CoA dehydrogenase [Platysternon megacephalum]|uniref:Acyl-CoA dehydrogenase n=1 Tax=Platysternon megacephalum TaxID=55544 RepID=A0A4D9DL16_9SAUR|nr:acyl-CoA dehydrogenase [Platysternon megacephalum]
MNLGSAEELRCLREALTAPDPEALFQASSKMARVVSEYFPSGQATDFIKATLDGMLSASPTCATAAGLWMKIILKECGDAMLDKVPDILDIIYSHMPTIQEGSLRQFLVEAVSILAHHHLEAVISSLLRKHLLMDRFSIEALESVLFKVGNERLVRALREQRTWSLLENPKTHHEGVCLLVRVLLRSGLVTPEIIQSLLPWVNSPTENRRVTSTAFLAQLMSDPMLREKKFLKSVLHILEERSHDRNSIVRQMAARGLGNLVYGAPEKVKKQKLFLLDILIRALNDTFSSEVIGESMKALAKVLKELKEKDIGSSFRATDPDLLCILRHFGPCT